MGESRKRSRKIISERNFLIQSTFDRSGNVFKAIICSPVWVYTVYFANWVAKNIQCPIWLHMSSSILFVDTIMLSAQTRQVLPIPGTLDSLFWEQTPLKGCWKLLTNPVFKRLNCLFAPFLNLTAPSKHHSNLIRIVSLTRCTRVCKWVRESCLPQETRWYFWIQLF